jgi:hypothetical protein
LSVAQPWLRGYLGVHVRLSPISIDAKGKI